MADDASGSAPKHTVSPEDLNAATASVFEGHIGLVFTETTPDRVCATVAIGPELRQAARRRPWRCVLLHRGKRRQLGRSTFPRRRRTRRVPPKLLGTAAEHRGSLSEQRVTAGECAVGQVRLHNILYEAA